MKKIFLSTFALVFYTVVNAQSFTWDLKGDTTVSIPVADSIVAFDSDLTNITTKSLTLQIIKQSISNGKNWAHYICADGSCYPPNQDTLTLTLSAGQKIEFKYDVDVVNPANGDNAEFRVLVVNSTNPDEYISKTFVVRVTQTSKQKSSAVHFAMYPNPASQNIQIQSNSLIQKVEILDISGRVLKESSNPSVNITSLSNGIYFLKVYDIQDNIGFAKFVKE